MPQPDRQEFLSANLTDFGIAYFQSRANFTADSTFGTIPVAKQSANYPVFDKQALLRDDMQVRPNGSESAGSGWSMSSNSYNCEVYALHKDITRRDRANWMNTDMTIEEAAVEYLVTQGLIARERQWVTDFFGTSIWATDATPGTTWDNDASTPIEDVATGKETVLAATGFEPNQLTVGYQVHRQLARHPDIVARVTGGGTGANPALVSEQAIAAILGVERYIVCRAVRATNTEGETAAYALLHGKHALLTYRPATPSPSLPQAGTTFVWDEGSDGLALTVSDIPMDALGVGTRRIEIEMAYDNVVTGSDLGYMMDDAVA